MLMFQKCGFGDLTFGILGVYFKVEGEGISPIGGLKKANYP